MLIIKDTSLDFQKIRDAMIKMESDRAFNTYFLAEAGVEIQTVPLFGIINIYVDGTSNLKFEDFITSWKQFEAECGETNNKVYKYIERETFPFGYVRSLDKVCRKISPANDMAVILSKKIKGTKNFEWFINIIRPGSLGFLCCSGIDIFCLFLLHDARLLHKYLISSTFTIMYDTVNLFKEEIRQLDFPRADQYMLYERGAIITDVIHIDSVHYPAITEFILYYLKQCICKNDSIRNEYTIKINFSDYHLTDMYDPFTDVAPEYITDGIDYSQEYADDLCFILDCPLFGKCVRFDLEYELDGKIIKTYIMLSSLIVNNQWKMPISICHRGKYQYGIRAILSMYKTKFRVDTNVSIKQKCTVIYLGCMLNGMQRTLINMKYPQNIKNLLEGILMNNCEIIKEENSPNIHVYVVNQNTNQIFVGMKTIRDVDIMKYANSSCILFTCYPMLWLNSD